ncbi:MAG: response regulator [Phycisphaerales bacterium]|nr:response regulator [Phycisphaerales bacterium]MCB9864891.1 response regulator [Phycisphaerales bacterium]
MSITKKKSVKAIQLDKDVIDAVNKQLDAAKRDVQTERRKAPRAATHIKACILHLPQPGVSNAPAYLVPTRDISNLGITFLHGAFVYPGSKGIVQLLSANGHWKNAVVHVVHSTYVRNGLHNTGARFATPIEARSFSAGCSTTRILIVEDNPSIAAMTQQRLTELEAEIQVAPTGEKALEAAKSQTFDAILMDMQLPGIDGFETTRRLRAQGFVGTIVAATGMTATDVKEKCIAAGCNSYLPKPLGREQLSALLASLRDAPLLSSLRNDPLMRPLIDEFIRDLPLRVQEFEAAFAEDDMAKLQNICRSLKGEAGGFGFARITDAASIVEKDIIAGTDKEAIRRGFESVIRICCQVRADFGG